MTARVRFAPSPTGYLHIGGVRTALFNWLWRKTGGAFILRIEDTDQARSTDASRDAIVDSLRWLGLDWDEGPFVQTDRLALYADAADRLVAAGKAYRCYCTTAELDAQRAALTARDPKARFSYPGTCRGRVDEPDRPWVIRFAVDRAGTSTYRDRVFGDRTMPNSELHDFKLVRDTGVPYYNFGVVVDDITMGITLVARGRDHMINTPPQLQLYRALGAAIPDFAHLPMMLAPDGTRLSKRHGAVSVGEYRALGYAPDAVLDYLSRFGWSPGAFETRMSRDELIAAFDWSRCRREDGMFDPQKFAAINHDHLTSPRLVPDDTYVACLRPFLADAPVERVVPVVRPRAHTFVEAADLAAPLLRDAPVLGEAAAAFLVEPALAHLRALRDALAALDPWSAPSLETAVAAWLASRGIALREIGQPLRAALTGRTVSPGLFDVMAFLGRDRTLARLAAVTGAA